MSKNRGCLSLLLGPFLPQKKSDYSEKYSPLEKEEITFPYHVRDDFLSKAELSFYQVLKSMMKDFMVICPKVSLAELFYVDHPNKNQSAFARIRQKRVDFVICDPATMQPKFAIELDDSSHQREDRLERDEFEEKVFEAANLPLVRIPAQLAYDTRLLGEQFKSALSKNEVIQAVPKNAPITSVGAVPNFCPKCGGKLVLRVAAQGVNQGKKFLGCSSYPKCNFLFPLPDSN